MNAIMKFYAMILSYLQADFEDSHIVRQIVDLSKKVSPSWETTKESIRFLEQCCNRNSSVKDDDTWSTTTNDFVKAAFKDLSVLKNPQAMELFQKLASAVLPTYEAGEDLLVWARAIKERPDGSAVIILHVSDLKRFRSLIENHDFVDKSTTSAILEDVIQIGS